MQKLGQHFLRNAEVIVKIVDAIAPADRDRVIEIGPGHGELTVPLLQATKGKHCEIVCVEKDRTLIPVLEALNAGEDTTLTIREGDVLKLLPGIVAGATPYKIAGNIPYYITGKLLRIISELKNRPERVVLLIQKEVAERICAVPPAMNRLAASVQFWANAKIVTQVPRKDFFPAPEVDSAVILLDGKPESKMPGIQPALYYRVMHGVFAQPRKTLLNNLSAIANGATKEEVADALQKIGVMPGSRPQDLSIDQIAAIAKIPLWG